MITSDTLGLDLWEHLDVYEDDSLVRLDFFLLTSTRQRGGLFFQSRAKDSGAFVLSPCSCGDSSADGGAGSA